MFVSTSDIVLSIIDEVPRLYHGHTSGKVCANTDLKLHMSHCELNAYTGANTLSIEQRLANARREL